MIAICVAEEDLPSYGCPRLIDLLFDREAHYRAERTTKGTASSFFCERTYNEAVNLSVRTSHAQPGPPIKCTITMFICW